MFRGTTMAIFTAKFGIF